VVEKHNEAKIYSKPVTTSSQKSAELHIFPASLVHFLHKNNTIEGQTRAFIHHSLLLPVSFKRSLAVTWHFLIKFDVGDSNIALKSLFALLLT